MLVLHIESDALDWTRAVMPIANQPIVPSPITFYDRTLTVNVLERPIG
jgi:hypothetical protein